MSKVWGDEQVMANYEYGHNNEGWKESRKHMLVESLNGLMMEMDYEG